MKFKLPVKDRVFWINFFQGLLIFGGAWLILSIDVSDFGTHFNFREGYDIASGLAVITLSGLIAMNFARFEK